MLFNENNRNENPNTNLKPNQQTHQIYRKEPNINYLKVKDTTKYDVEDDDSEELEDYDNEINKSSFNNSFVAFDSLKNYRKVISRGNSRNNIRINNKIYYNNNNNNNNNNKSNDNSNSELSKNNNNNYNYKRNIIHAYKSDNSIENDVDDENEDIDDNKNYEPNEVNESDNEFENQSNQSEELKNEKVKPTPRNEVNSNNDNEEFNELFINKSYILKKFDKMMDDLGLTTEGRETLSNLSLEKKWEIFKLQKNKINNECLNPNIDPNSNDNSPKHFISLLKKKSINVKMLTKLRFMISDDSSSWLTNFIKYGGYYYLNRIIFENVMKDSKTNKDWIIHENLIRCIRGLFHSRIGLETLYSDPTPLLLLTLSLFYHQLVHLKKDINYDTSVQSLFLSSSSVLPLTNRTLIFDMLSYLTKIETPIGWNMVIDSLHWVSLGNGDKNLYIEDINNRLALSKEKIKQISHSKSSSRKTLKGKTLKSFKFSSLSNIHKSILTQPSFFSNLNLSQKAKSLRNGNENNNNKNNNNNKMENTSGSINNNSNTSNSFELTFSDLFTEDFSYHLAFSLLQEEYQLQGYSQYQDLNKDFSSSHIKMNTQNSNSENTSVDIYSNSNSFIDINQNELYNQYSSQTKFNPLLTFPRNQKVNIYSSNNNETNLYKTSSTALSVPNLNNIDKNNSIDNCSYTESDLSSKYIENNFNNNYNSSNTMNSVLSELTIGNSSINNLNSYTSLNDNEFESKKYSIKNQHNIKKVPVNSSTTYIPRFCPFTFWMKDFKDCAREYNQLFLGNNLSSKIIFNTLANKTYRWAPMVSASKEIVDQEQAINYICTNLNLITSILENVPEQTAQNRLAIIKCFKLCRIDKIFQKLGQSKNADLLNLTNQCIQKDLARNLEEFSLSIFKSKDLYSICGSVKSPKSKDSTIVKNISRKIIRKKRHASIGSINNITDNLDLDFNKNSNVNDSGTIYNEDLSSTNNLDKDNRSNTINYGSYLSPNSYQNDKIKQLNDAKGSMNKISLSFNSLHITDSIESVTSEINTSNKHMSMAHKSQVIGRSHARRIKMK
ncbi:hypothetical protein BCR32DRAFT_271364 [Anaeromyces robustus]|uniref:Formin GTPase-binding domain-containing protein n=1 Tax=Anaeromyces robustus TaxID=1754192 RepID=A0A1Y1WSL7_9FUNG|nr:hypothetical protein BCR32DRAFT_271364 [Anaeromyces robustus]|eukprot:ORX76288.1 hypothetical protein BCR32DRAFT_271364 [Anaeromyces robustus]